MNTRTHVVTTLQGVTAPAMERSDHSRTSKDQRFAVDLNLLPTGTHRSGR
jgi:hypothetical protein